MRYADLDGYKGSLLGAYLLRYMTPAARAARFVGGLANKCVVLKRASGASLAIKHFTFYNPSAIKPSEGQSHRAQGLLSAQSESWPRVQLGELGRK
jgi:hypothetical protein